MLAHRWTRTKALILGAAGLALGTAFGPSLATAGVESVKNVFVTNDEDDEAIPVRSVGTFPAEIRGTPRVEVAGTPEVRLGEPVAVRGNVTTVRGRPFQATGSLTIGGPAHIDSDIEQVFIVPEGKDLLVTFATVQAGEFSQTGTAAPPAITTLTSAEGPGIQVFLPLERQGPEPFWSASLPLEVTFPSRLFFSASIRNRTATGFLRYDYTVSGYLVDEPAS